MAKQTQTQNKGRRIILPRPLYYQAEILKALNDDKTKFVTWCASRRIGKTLLSCCWSISQALNKRCSVGYVCPTSSLCRRLIRKICDLLRGSGCIISSNTVDMFILFANGSTISFLSAESFARGAGNFDGGMVFDECGYLDDETFKSVFLAMVLEAPKVLFCSSPNGCSGVFYDYFNKGKSGDKRYKSFATTLEESGLYDKQTIQDIKDGCTKNVWQQEYCASFLASGVSAFEGFEKRLIKEPAQRTAKLYAGIDFSGASSGEDSTVLTVVNDKMETVGLHMFKHGDTKTLNEIAELLNLYNVTMCYAEANSMGQLSIEILKSKFKRITPITATNETKRAIIEHVIRNFEQGKGAILDTPQTRMQFANFVQKRTKTGLITYGNLRDSIHDDLVCSFAYACYACKCCSRVGQYCVS
jgi:hypothetical protein